MSDRFSDPLKVSRSARVRALLLGATVAASLVAGPAFAEEVPVITLTQTPCQFIEVEKGGDLGFTSTKKADCEKINAESGAERLASASILRLKAGDYVFRVKNKNVPYDLGFWLREKGYDEAGTLRRLVMTSVSGGGIGAGVTKDYEVELEPGEYIYSCPLNPTPNYRIIVEG